MRGIDAIKVHSNGFGPVDVSVRQADWMVLFSSELTHCNGLIQTNPQFIYGRNHANSLSINSIPSIIGYAPCKTVAPIFDP